jgi:predicted Zn finger-like uncharacterized protein
MSEVVNCPKCERKLRVPDELIGKKVKCPTCSETFTATVAPGGEAPAAPPSEPPPRPRPPREDDIQAEDRPSKRSPRREDDDLEFEDKPRSRPRRRASGDYAPHRGTMILVFGILAIVGICSIVFGPIAWIMGNSDLKEIRAGRMDPEGESMTNIGRILGMVATILNVVCIAGYCIVIIFMGGIGALGGGGGGR